MSLTVLGVVPPGKQSIPSVAAHLTEVIRSGVLAVGDLLPTEIELAHYFHTSRHTIRGALSQLQLDGLVSRAKSVGTRVVSSSPRSRYRASLTSLDELVQLGTEHARVIVQTSEVVADACLAREISCDTGTRWLRVSSVRLARLHGSDIPIGWSDVYLPTAYADVVRAAQQRPGTLISNLIEALHGRKVAQVRQDVHPVLVGDKDLADRLGVAAGTLALKVVRRYLDSANELFEASVSIHPADRFTLSTTLIRANGEEH